MQPDQHEERIAKADDLPLRVQFKQHLYQLTETALTQKHLAGRMDPLTAVKAEIERLCVEVRPVLSRGAVWREYAELIQVASDRLTGDQDEQLASDEVSRLEGEKTDLDVEMATLFEEYKDTLRRLGYWLRIQGMLIGPPT